jgi:hypothetical protein
MGNMVEALVGFKIGVDPGLLGFGAVAVGAEKAGADCRWMTELWALIL